MRKILFASALCVTIFAYADFAYADNTEITVTNNAVQASTSSLILRGWQPHIMIAGQGDSISAVPRIREAVKLQQNVLLRTKMDADSQNLMNQFWGTFEDFNLKNLYALLPDQTSDWHGVAFSGEPTAGNYFIRRQPGGVTALTENKADVNTLEFGQVKAAVALKPSEDTRGTRYSFKQAGEIGLGKVSWNSVLEAGRETLDIMSHDTPSSRELIYLNSVKQMGPQLSAEDQRIVAELWAAFPASWSAFAKTATVSQVTATPHQSNGTQHLSITFVGDSDHLAKYYPHVEKYLERLGDVMDATVVMQNATGQWLTLRIDSKTMQTNVDVWLKDGRLVPTKSGEPLILALEKNWPKEGTWQADITMRFRALGVVTTLNNWQMDWTYLQQEKMVSFDGTLKDKPTVSIDGRALGVMPASWLAHMPVNIYKIVDDFMSVLVESNYGRGAKVNVQFDESDQQHSKVMAKASWDGLDNFFVRMGVSMVVDKMIPDSPTSEEIRGLLFDSQIAFSRDLEQFASSMEVAEANQQNQAVQANTSVQ